MKRRPPPPQNQPSATWSARWWLIPIVLGCGCLGWYLWRTATTPVPPALPLEGVDRPVAEALLEARAAVVRAPRSAQAWGRLGMLLYTHSFGSQAEPCFAQAARLDPTAARWPYLQALNRHGRSNDDTDPLFQEAIERSPDDHTIRLRFAEDLIRRGESDVAAEQLQRVIRSDPKNPWAQYLLGQIAALRGDHAESVAHLQRSAAAAPHARCAHLALALAYEAQGDQPAAAAARRAAAELSGEFPWTDPHAEAAEELNVGIPARLAFARHLLTQGRGREAMSVLTGAARLAPENATVHLEIGTAWLRLGDAAAAEGPLREAVRLDATSADALFNLGLSLKRQQRHAEAAEQFRRLTELVPSHATTHFNLAMCWKALGETDEAEKSLRLAARYRPEIAQVHRELGILLAEENRPAESAIHLEHALRLAPDDAAAQEWLARVRQGAPVPTSRDPVAP